MCRDSSTNPNATSPKSSGNGPACPAPADWKQWLRRRLLHWYARSARDLPWRRTRDPYAIWVSEIMLQQTQVATVCDYFTRFLEAFPNIRSLAAADEQRVLRQWEGLGYYRRARQMHRAARKIVAEHGGRFPRDRDAVLALPGIGRYTAGAILSIAFDAREPVLEANTLRLVCRLIAYRDNPRNAAGQRRLWEAVSDWLPRRRVGAFNQALMELGSLICTPRDPQCDACPLAARCPTFQAGLQAEIPVPAKRPVTEHVYEAAVAVRNNGRVLLLYQDEASRWAGLWDFPRFRVSATRGEPLHRELVEKVHQTTGIRIRRLRRIATMRHGVTRYRISLLCHEAQHASGRLRGGRDRARWVPLERLDQYPLNTTGRKLCHLLRP